MKDNMDVRETREVAMDRGVEASIGTNVKGRVEITLYDGDMNVKDHEVTHNLMTNLGRDWIADALAATPAISDPLGMKLGQGTTGPAAGNTDVETVLTADPADAFQTFTAGFPKDDYAGHANETTFETTWAAGEATFAAITESVIKVAGAGATAVSRITFTAKDKQAADTLTIRVFWAFTAA